MMKWQRSPTACSVCTVFGFNKKLSDVNAGCAGTVRFLDDNCTLDITFLGHVGTCTSTLGWIYGTHKLYLNTRLEPRFKSVIPQH